MDPTAMGFFSYNHSDIFAFLKGSPGAVSGAQQCRCDQATISPLGKSLTLLLPLQQHPETSPSCWLPIFYFFLKVVSLRCHPAVSGPTLLCATFQHQNQDPAFCSATHSGATSCWGPRFRLRSINFNCHLTHVH